MLLVKKILSCMTCLNKASKRDYVFIYLSGCQFLLCLIIVIVGRQRSCYNNDNYILIFLTQFYPQAVLLPYFNIKLRCLESQNEKRWLMTIIMHWRSICILWNMYFVLYENLWKCDLSRSLGLIPRDADNWNNAAAGPANTSKPTSACHR